MKDFLLGGWAVLGGLPLCKGVELTFAAWLGLVTAFSIMSFVYYWMFKRCPEKLEQS